MQPLTTSGVGTACFYAEAGHDWQPTGEVGMLSGGTYIHVAYRCSKCGTHACEGWQLKGPNHWPPACSQPTPAG